jgi:hypothetical protein
MSPEAPGAQRGEARPNRDEGRGANHRPDLTIEERLDDSGAALADPFHAGEHQGERQRADQTQPHAERDMRLGGPIGGFAAPHGFAA